jgi:hypothetical protein
MTDPQRSEPYGCQHEPPYPGLETVTFSVRFPDMTCHHPSERCAIQEPHQIEECGEFDTGGTDDR